MTTILIPKCKKFRYSVIGGNGNELMKFYTRKVALAFAEDEDAYLIHKRRTFAVC